MSDDLDKLLRESLRKVGDDFEAGHQRRRPEARARFLARNRRRRWVFPAVSVAAIAAAVVAAVVVGGTLVERAGDETEGGTVAGQPRFEVVTELGAPPTDIGAHEGEIWVADPEGGRVLRLDAKTGEIADTVDLGGRPEYIGIGPDRVWVGDGAAGTIVRIEPETNAPVDEPIEVGPPAQNMTISVGTALVWAVVGNDLVTIDPVTREVTVIDASRQPIDVSAHLGSVWVLDAARGLLHLDGTTGEELGDPRGVRGLTGDVFADQGTLWIADFEDDTIVRLDRQGGFAGTTPVPGAYIDLAVGKKALWVLSRTAEGTQLNALDLVNGAPLAPAYVIEGDPTKVVVGGGGVWLTLRGENAVARIDAERFLARN